MRWLIPILAGLMPLPSVAQTVGPCEGWPESAAAIAEPWEDNSRLYAKGAIRVAVLDTIEPAAGSFHLLVLSPPFDALGGRQCRVVSMVRGMGFGGLTLDGVEAGYDPARGLTLRLPARIWRDSDRFETARVRVTINQATGAVSADLD